MSLAHQEEKQGNNGTEIHPDRVRTKMVRVTVNLPAELADGMRDAVYWTPGLTLAWFIASAIRTSLAELESFNRAPFPKRTSPLRPGRPRLSGLMPKATRLPLGQFYRPLREGL